MWQDSKSPNASCATFPCAPSFGLRGIGIALASSSTIVVQLHPPVVFAGPLPPKRPQHKEKSLAPHQSVARARTSRYKNNGLWASKRKVKENLDGPRAPTDRPPRATTKNLSRPRWSRRRPRLSPPDTTHPNTASGERQRTHHVEKVLLGWFPCSLLQRKVRGWWIAKQMPPCAKQRATSNESDSEEHARARARGREAPAERERATSSSTRHIRLMKHQRMLLLPAIKNLLQKWGKERRDEERGPQCSRTHNQHNSTGTTTTGTTAQNKNVPGNWQRVKRHGRYRAAIAMPPTHPRLF
jgi:hypothetical protein